ASNSIWRFNISVNDSLAGVSSVGTLNQNGGGQKVQYYNNTAIGAHAQLDLCATSYLAGSLIQNNIFVATNAGQTFGTNLCNGSVDASNVSIKNNLYFSTQGADIIFNIGGSFFNLAQWQSQGREIGSIIANPFFNPAEQSFTWDPTQHTGPQ